MRLLSVTAVLLFVLALGCSCDSRVPVNPDPWPPLRPTEAVADLAITKATQSRVTLQWTAPVQSREEGHMLMYDVRYAVFPLTDSSWQEASSYIGPWFYFSDVMIGEEQSCTISLLLASTTYYFGLMARGSGKDWSPISNVATVTTRPNGSIEPINRLQSDDLSTHLGVLALAHSYLYVQEGYAEHFPYTSLAAYDMANPLQPVRAVWPQVVEHPRVVRPSGNRLYVLSGTKYPYPYSLTPSKLSIFQALPASPVLLGTYTFDDSVFNIDDQNFSTTWVKNLVADGDQLFMIRDTSINVMNIQDESRPFVKTTYILPANLRGTSLLLAGSKLTWANTGEESSQISILDISDPDNLRVKCVFETGANVHGIVINGNVLYAFMQTHEIRIIDVSDLSAPVLKSVFPLAWYTTSGAIQGNHLYVGGAYGIYAINVADPTAPAIVDSCDYVGGNGGIVADNDYLYVSGGCDICILKSRLP